MQRQKTLFETCSSERQEPESDDRSSFEESIHVDPPIQLLETLSQNPLMPNLNHPLLYCHTPALPARTDSIDLSKIASSFVSVNDRRLQHFGSM